MISRKNTVRALGMSFFFHIFTKKQFLTDHAAVTVSIRWNKQLLYLIWTVQR